MVKKKLFLLLCFMAIGLSGIAQGSDGDKALDFFTKNNAKSLNFGDPTKVPQKEVPQTVDKLTFIKVPNEKPSKLEKEGWKKDLSKLLLVPRIKSIGTKAITTETVLRSYVEKDTSSSDGSLRVSGVKIEKIKDDSVRIINFFGADDTIKALVKPAENTISIMPQKIMVVSGYDIYCCPVDIPKKVYYTDSPIIGKIADDGFITFGSWGGFVIAGDMAGGSIGAYTGTAFIPTNATMTDVLTDGKSKTYDVLVEQTYDNQIRLTNIAGQGFVADVNLNSNKSVEMAPQYMFFNSSYGDFYCYPANWTSSTIAKYGYINGTGTPNSIAFGNWAIAARYDPTKVGYAVTSSSIVLPTMTISYPAVATLDYEGDGSAETPYLIKTASDLNKLSSLVKSGNNFKDKYIKLANDIDFANFTSALKSIGESSSSSFEGTFDGDSKTISNFTMNQGEIDNVGLFGYLGANGTVKNLNLKDVNMTSYGRYSGTIVGSAYGNVDNCSVSGTTVVYNYTGGGIVGYLEGKVSNCTFSGNMGGVGDTGGIVGTSKGNIEKCSTKGTVMMIGYLNSLYRGLGGVLGSSISPSNAVSATTDCYAMGIVADKTGYGYVGGVSGELLNASLTRCFNTAGLVSSATTTTAGTLGGVTGIAYGANVKDSYNAGYIINSNIIAKIGGVVGYILTPMSDGSYSSTFTNVYNSGEVSMATITDNVGLYGVKYDSFQFNNSFFDKQTTGCNSDGGKLTTELATATPFDGFSTDVWTFTANLYPRLKGIDDNEAAYLSAAPMFLTNGETTKKIKRDFTVSTLNKISWKAVDANGNFVASTDGLSISGKNVTLKRIYSNEMIAALTASGFAKHYSLQLIKPYTFDGDGTEASPYLIKSKADLLSLQDATTIYAQTHEGDFFKMTNDIDVEKDATFVGIAADNVKTHVFSGTFDGDGHSIKGLSLKYVKYGSDGKATSSGSSMNVSLFGYVSDKATIKNLVIDKDNDYEFWAYGGAIASNLSGTIENCKNYADITGISSYIGGIAGQTTATSKIIGCYNAGKVRTGNSYVGGMVGYGKGSVMNCQNDGEIAAEFVNAFIASGKQSDAAGMVANNYGAISNCANTGYVHAFTDAGGFVSSANTGTSIDKCVNTGIVSCLEEDDNYLGAIVGYGYTNSNVSNSYYDAQLNPFGAVSLTTKAGANPLTTIKLVSGTPLDSLDANIWLFEKDSYPVLKAFAAEKYSVANKKMTIEFGENENRTDVKSISTLASFEGLNWALKISDKFKIQDGKLSVTMPTNEALACDTLIATYDGYSKMIPLRAIPSILKGAGTEADPYLIESTDDMLKLSKFVNSNRVEYYGAFFKVTKDLDFTNCTYEPLGLANVKFQGIFDGNNKTFSNVIYNSTNTDSYLGLFGSVGEKGMVKNLTLDKSCSFASYSYCAAFVGKLYGTVDNCVNNASVGTNSSSYVAGIASMMLKGSKIKKAINNGALTSKTTYVGGIAGYANNDCAIDSCINNGVLTAPKGYVGGIAAYSGANISNSINTASISSTTYIGGIVSNSFGNDSIFKCINSGAIVGTSGTIGGIVGSTVKLANALVDSCYNSGTVNGGGYVGGIIGSVNSGTTITNSVNTGDITSSSSNVGGVVGNISSLSGYRTDLTNCLNLGDVYGNSNYVGGVAGSTDDECVVDGCINKGSVLSGGNYVGGFSGSGNGLITNCYNAGDVTANGYGIGGFAGIGTGVATNCFNVGNVTSVEGKGNTGRYANVGGFWGYGKPELTNCYNMGVLTAPDYVGGLVGIPFDGLKITNSYNAGKIVVPATATNAGNITMNNTVTVTFTNAYYDKTVNSTVVAESDKLGVAKTTKELTMLNMGTDFLNNDATYPILKNFEKDSIPNFYAATVIFDDDNDFTNVTKDFTIV